MKQKYLQVLQSTIYWREILKINRLFQKEKIDFLFLKGLPLHLLCEKSYPQRIYGDCDLLVAKKDRQKVIVLLQKLGYTKVNDELSPIITRRRGQELEISFRRSVKNVLVVFDVHFEIPVTIVHLNRIDQLYPQNLIDQLANDCLKNKKKVVILNSQFSILNSQFLILYLAINFYHHNFRGAFRLELLNNIIRQGHLRGVLWTNISKKILDYKLQNFVYPVFVLLKKLYQTPFPKYFLKTIQPFNHLTMKRFENINIFESESRINAGITRFKYLFLLSPEPLRKKVFVFLNPQVLYSILWVMRKRLRSYFFSKARN